MVKRIEFSEDLIFRIRESQYIDGLKEETINRIIKEFKDISFKLPDILLEALKEAGIVDDIFMKNIEDKKLNEKMSSTGVIIWISKYVIIARKREGSGSIYFYSLENEEQAENFMRILPSV